MDNETHDVPIMATSQESSLSRYPKVLKSTNKYENLNFYKISRVRKTHNV